MKHTDKEWKTYIILPPRQGDVATWLHHRTKCALLLLAPGLWGERRFTTVCVLDGDAGPVFVFEKFRGDGVSWDVDVPRAG